ncbi:SCP-like extracellular [Candidatus Protofrankia datiscae]|uniref:SCP-like extracellular n=1 Tax=Candidatus Protofrankia datiscae TaxID=2716812 RepID=F8B1P3_9ACTN|nr:CAP domain-containing protein [Protofrankia symbiont of Coriaria myrtifolia]AEH08137.1 SCP-like extracellular [Candidatus Protofrankia datiscae]
MLLLTRFAAPAGTDGSVVVAPALASSTAVLALAARSTAQPTTDRGTVSGIVRLRATASADTRTWVAFVLRGPTTNVQMAPTAPYEATVDTRLLPDGAYTLAEIVFHPSRTPSIRASQLRIVNTPPRLTATQVPAQPQPTADLPAVPAPVTPATPATPPPATSAAPALVARVSSPALPVTPVTSAPSDRLLGEVSEVIALTNAERARVGCAALTTDRRLITAAQAHSADMSAHDYFSHDSLDGRTPFQRITKAGYEFSAAAENIAAGQRTPAEVVRGWMNSAGHRANILNCSLKQIGVGYATGGRYGTYWTQDFGTP